MKPIKNAAISLLSAGLLVGLAVGMGPAVEREGDAQRQQSLRDIETKPMNADLLAGLDSWTHAKPLTAESMKGRVVLMAMISADDPQSMLMLSTLARYERQNGDDGLVVLAVHPELGWDKISEKVSAGRVKVQVARDTGGALAAGLQADDYPDLFLIDRAGQLRYADIENKSLKSAVGQLLREDEAQAVANAQLQAQGLDIAEAGGSETGGKVEVTSADYANASWPAHNSNKLSASDFQGKPLPAALGNEEWITEKKDLEGKVLVLDFWATWCGPCRAASPKLEELQRELEGKVEVLAIGGASDDEGNHKKYVYAHNKAYSNLYDKKDTINNALSVRGIPHTVVLSTDGVIRWQGNPLNDSFADVVRDVVAADPMLNPKKVTSGDSAGSAGAKSIPTEAYANARWPEINRGRLSASDFQGKALPVPLGNEEWLTEERDLEGKVLVLDFWATWCGPCKRASPILQRMQLKHRGKVEVLAIGGASDDEATHRDYVKKHKKAYSNLYDKNSTINSQLRVKGIPHTVIISTDGVIRWQGNPLSPDFTKALDRVVAVDPMFD